MQLERIIDKIAAKVRDELDGSFEIEASGRHIHLSQEDLEKLFGKDYTLTKAKDLSQPGQYACKERLTILGPKGAFQNVVILGPVRGASQVEVSLTDCLKLGVNAPIRESGQIENTPGIILVNGSKVVSLENGLIVAKRHIHMTPEDAAKANVVNQEIVQVQVGGERGLIFDDVVIRVHPKFATYMHIDYDEANACGFKKGMRGRILKKG
ncbi:ethanolamine utilization phosphate acetyltransferase EutD [Streptococcus suis]|uniref:ethanolamine utilization phosphate acetyltransferase EutD n=1 Tax=Streptococcus suis TaxID=1307 RepID=UPI000CF5412B|nr:ethanolamine utilization phosphate acetyltransferase EutD [Streptococcus suis]MDW8758728.1 ethanolamine utilization phosphate acetyltransferase EutD [Streptococcus suis]HEM5997324.1 phosphate propanoyltransferase [Streptococcus suis]HEM6082195.1 phosphate propanoyltransferase [Streptococcus suis]HEM6137147.1 phosphate propanoyltransferase [Streptococcus suis]HEM6221290.1 phosphate propanoyltransferase [Streptococcus suis]